MCGIVGGIADRNITPILIEGLKRLEYRGYDSAGLAVYVEKSEDLCRHRRMGKVQALADAIEKNPIWGKLGIAHTRWATHGIPSEANAHPHFSGDRIAVVHNGIIENYQKLREKLIQANYQFSSDTDTEVIAHLVHQALNQGASLLESVHQAMQSLEGAYSIGVVDQAQPDKLIAGRKGSPLVIGVGIGEHFIASDQLALLPVTNRFIYLDEGDLAQIELNQIQIYNNIYNNASQSLVPVERAIHELDASLDTTDKGPFRHYMLKEIYEQPDAIRRTLEGRIDAQGVLEQAFGIQAKPLLDQARCLQIIACGTSFHAASIAKYWFEDIAGIPCQVEIASEFRYRNPCVQPGTLFVTISQSGETADTLAALRESKRKPYIGSLAICNVPTSSLVRESDLSLMTSAGPEIGVASTKAFVTQLVALFLLVISVGRRHGLSQGQAKLYVDQLRDLPSQVASALSLDKEIEQLSVFFGDKQHALFLGRGTQYPVAMEGALKLKEISYIHAEAYAAGELKHGPLALVDQDMPVIAVAPNDELIEKLKSNLQEVRARGGELIIFADKSVDIAVDIAKEGSGSQVILLPNVSSALAPILYTVPLQLLAYHVAIIKGTDVDQPRNLAKSVTVE